MRRNLHLRYPVLVTLFGATFAPPSPADEGMWLINDLPTELLQRKYDFVPRDQWAEHVMHSAVRFSSGGSGSFVSSDGLVLTNHHVVADTLHKLSTPDDNIYENGFLARAPGDELKAPDLELNQLVSIEDVTEQVAGAVTDDMDAGEAYRARRAAMADIEQKSLQATGLRSDVVTLYGGAKYHLYRYRRFTDVRLVWAPESSAAFFGGDADNFEFPRYCLDAALVRVYEDGQPATIEHFFQWSEAGADDGELVFVPGHPGNTQRITTVAGIKNLRDRILPYYLDAVTRMEVALQQFANESPEHERRARDDLLGYQNSRKALTGMLLGLQSPQFIRRKVQEEKSLRARLQADPQLKHFDDAWQAIAEAEEQRASIVGMIPDLRSKYYEFAKHLVLLASEDEKPSAERLREYRESARQSLELELFSPAPIYDDLEAAKLATQISLFVERRGGDDPIVQTILGGKNPRERATQLVSQSSLNNVQTRRKLAEGGAAAIEASDDPLIRLFAEIEPEYRRLREQHDKIDELKQQSYAQIEDAKLVLEGPTGYPDATFTLRVAYGVVKGYEEDGTQVRPWTTFDGAYRHEAEHGAKAPWNLPPSWHRAKNELDLSTRLNFVCTADIVGGNSGSPVINREGQVVGLIFDSNLQGLTASYYYDDVAARAVCVHSSAIREALRAIYHAPKLAEELGR